MEIFACRHFRLRPIIGPMRRKPNAASREPFSNRRYSSTKTCDGGGFASTPPCSNADCSRSGNSETISSATSPTIANSRSFAAIRLRFLIADSKNNLTAAPWPKAREPWAYDSCRRADARRDAPLKPREKSLISGSDRCNPKSLRAPSGN